MARRDFGQNTWTIPVATASTNLGPLTTPFALPSDCNRNLYNFQTVGLIPGDLYTYYTQGCAISSCCPPNLTPYTAAYQWLSTYYSPGVCPLSWRQCDSPSNLQSKSGESIAFCCPVTYLCPDDPPVNTNAPWWACQSALGFTTTAYVMDNLFDQSTITTQVLTYTGTYNVAYPIQIRWKEGDVRTTIPVTGSVSPAASQTSKTPDATSTTSTIAAPDNSSLKISLGVGLGVGVPIALLLIYALFYLSRQLRKHSGSWQDRAGQHTPAGVDGKSELEAPANAQPLVTQYISELPPNPARGGTFAQSELEAPGKGPTSVVLNAAELPSNELWYSRSHPS